MLTLIGYPSTSSTSIPLGTAPVDRQRSNNITIPPRIFTLPSSLSTQQNPLFATSSRLRSPTKVYSRASRLDRVLPLVSFEALGASSVPLFMKVSLKPLPFSLAAFCKASLAVWYPRLPSPRRDRYSGTTGNGCRWVGAINDFFLGPRDGGPILVFDALILDEAFTSVTVGLGDIAANSKWFHTLWTSDLADDRNSMREGLGLGLPDNESQHRKH